MTCDPQRRTCVDYFATNEVGEHSDLQENTDGNNCNRDQGNDC